MKSEIVTLVVAGIAALMVLPGMPMGKVAASSGYPLRTEANHIVYPDGTRFIIKGANVEAFRDYAGGCGGYTDILFPNNSMNEPPQLLPMIQSMKNIHINAVRLNYSLSFLSMNNDANLAKYLDIAQAFADNGIYVMISDHAQTGSSLTYESASFPMFKKIIDGARARGIENYVFVNPFNEPGDMAWSSWVTANKAILDYLRSDANANYKGLVMLDTPSWSSSTDVSPYTYYKAITDYDTALLGGKANVGFENHYYPNHTPDTNYIDRTLEASKYYPLAIGELGKINPGSSGDIPAYPVNIMQKIVSPGIANGHNGIFAWIWAWCDSNKMTDPWNDYSTLTDYGKLYVTNYYSVVPDSKPNTSVTLTPTPIATKAPTATPSPKPTSYPAAAIAFRAATSGSNGTGGQTLQFAKPAGTATNDVMIAQIAVRGASGTTITPPAGWTLIRRDNTTSSLAEASYFRVADSAEPATYVWSFNSSQMASGGIAAYANANTANPIEVSAGYYNYETPIAYAPEVTTTVNGDMVIFLDAVTAATTVDQPTGMTERWDVSNGDASTGTTAEFADKVQATSGSTGGLQGNHNNSTKSNLTQVIVLRPMPLQQQTAIPGDANGDKAVNQTDYAIWLGNYGKETSMGAGGGDFNGDARVDGIDYVIWMKNYTD